MHSILRGICLCLLLLLALPLSVSAAETDPIYDLYETIDPSAMEIPADVAADLEAEGIDVSAPESILTLSPDSLLQRFLHTLLQEITAPFSLLGGLLSMTLLSALLKGTGDAAGGMQSLMGTLFVLVCVGGAADPVCRIFLRTAQVLDEGHAFMISYVPVFASFLAAGGSIAGGTSYQVFLLFLTELMAALTNHILFPLLQMATAIGIVDAVNPKLGLGCFVSGFKTAVTWTLGFLMTMFSALLSVRSFVASAADSLASKSLRLITSSLIPIVGSAVSDAYGTLQGSIRLLRNGVGAVGILVILWLVLPPLLSLLLYRVLFAIVKMFAEMAGDSCLASLFQHLQSIMATAFAIVTCFSLMLIFSSAIMLLLVQGT